MYPEYPLHIYNWLLLDQYLFMYLWFYVTFNTVQVISWQVVGRAEETSTYSLSGFCTVNCRPTASNYQLSHLRPCREVCNDWKSGYEYKARYRVQTWNIGNMMISWYTLMSLLSSQDQESNLRNRSHGGTVVRHLLPTSENRVQISICPKVGKLVVACLWSAVHSAEPWPTVCFLHPSNYLTVTKVLGNTE